LFKVIEEEQLENDANHVRTDAPRSEGESIGWNSTVEFQRLYDSTFQILLKVAYRVTNNWEAAEDICQDSFFRLYEKNMVFPNKEEAKYWLIRVVKNAALNYAKRKARERIVYQRAFREDHRREETGEGLLVKKETSEEVKNALEKLPENLRMVLILKEYGDMNYKEIGKVLGISEGNVKVRVFRARERLASLLAASQLVGSQLVGNIDLQGGKNVS
jgi:RNA polymerase sigma-70 factor (ECF subfamily)